MEALLGCAACTSLPSLFGWVISLAWGALWAYVWCLWFLWNYVVVRALGIFGSRWMVLGVSILSTSASTPPASEQCPKQKLLPPQTEAMRGRMTVVLDMDHTLICACHASEAHEMLGQHDFPCHSTFMHLPFGRETRKQRQHQQTLQQQQAQQVAAANCGLPVQPVLVLQRPGLRDFLRRVAAFAELVLFTAAIPEYANPVVSQVIDPEGSLFQGRLLFREHGQMRLLPMHGEPGGAGVHCVKDLSDLGRDLSRVVLVDNNPVSFLAQPANGIPCLPFRNDPNDRHLSAVLLPLLQSLALFPDVRPILEARFRMASWFAQRGFPAPPAAAAPLLTSPAATSSSSASWAGSKCGGGAISAGGDEATSIRR